MLSGLLVIWSCYKSYSWVGTRSRSKAVLVALSLLGTALGTYYYLLKQDFDPDWSLAKAFKWCQERKWIHVDTTPFYAMVR